MRTMTMMTTDSTFQAAPQFEGDGVDDVDDNAVLVMMEMVVVVKMTSPFRLPHSVMLSVEKGVEVRLEIAWRTSTFVMIGIVLCKKECERKRQDFF